PVFRLRPGYTDGGDAAAEMEGLLTAVNSARGGLDAMTALPKLKVNLSILADGLVSIGIAANRRAALQTIRDNVEAQRTLTDGIFALQRALIANVDQTIVKAANLNAAAKTVPLEAPYDLLGVGQFFSSKTVTVTLKQGQRLPLFDITGVSDSTRINP